MVFCARYKAWWKTSSPSSIVQGLAVNLRGRPESGRRLISHPWSLEWGCDGQAHLPQGGGIFQATVVRVDTAGAAKDMAGRAI